MSLKLKKLSTKEFQGWSGASCRQKIGKARNLNQKLNQEMNKQYGKRKNYSNSKSEGREVPAHTHTETCTYIHTHTFSLTTANKDDPRGAISIILDTALLGPCNPLLTLLLPVLAVLLILVYIFFFLFPFHSQIYYFLIRFLKRIAIESSISINIT